MIKRVLVLVAEYPQISETYIKNEVDELCENFEVEIVALNPGNYPYRSRRPHIVINKSNQQNVIAYLRGFGPQVIHAHYYHLAEQAVTLSRMLDIPFTLRNHSFDVLGPPLEKLAKIASSINCDNCLGMLTFPYTTNLLLKAGVHPEKIHPCFPAIKLSRFYDTSPNGRGVMNVGAAKPKKNMEDFMRLSTIVTDRTFNLYGMGYDIEKLRLANVQLGGRVNFVEPIEPESMLEHYKRHEWLVYTASNQIGTVGWPMAVAEAQAAGVGVCVQDIRRDLRDYVGDAGFFFKTPQEAAEIVCNPFPHAMRDRGFALAKRSDIAQHLHLLTDLWRRQESPRL